MSSEVFKSYQPQSFALPDSVIYYITKKPSNPKGYQKLIQSCKYFFSKNTILVFHCLRFKKNEWKTCLDGSSCLEYKKVNFNNAKDTVAKLWILDYLTIDLLHLDPSFTSKIIPKLYKYDSILVLILLSQKLFFDELLLFSSAEKFIFYHVSVISKQGTLISIPKIMNSFPKLDVITFGFDADNALIFTPNIVKEILKIPHFHEFTHFTLFNIPETFDIYTFYEFMKKNKKTQFDLVFSHTYSEEYRNRLETIVDEILTRESHNYKVPFIVFPGMDGEKQKKLKTLSGTYLLK